MDDTDPDTATQGDDRPNVLLVFTDFQAAPVCTPSRAALMTGSYAARVGLGESVLFPGDDEGLHPDEVTVADALSTAGYSTRWSGRGSPTTPS